MRRAEKIQTNNSVYIFLVKWFFLFPPKRITLGQAKNVFFCSFLLHTNDSDLKLSGNDIFIIIAILCLFISFCRESEQGSAHWSWLIEKLLILDLNGVLAHIEYKCTKCLCPFIQHIIFVLNWLSIIVCFCSNYETETVC